MPTLSELLNSQQSGIAVEAPGRAPLSYSRLLDHIHRTADRLRNLGIGPGDRVVSVLPAGPDAATAIAAISSQATIVPLDPGATEPEYELLFRILEPRAILIPAGVAHLAAEAASACRVPVLEALAEGEAGMFSLDGQTSYLSVSSKNAISPEDPAYILSTSGTTGIPKLVPVSHGSACSTVASIADALKMESTDACLVFTPLFHSLGVVSGVLVPLSTGSRSIFLPGFEVQQFFKSLEEYRPTWFSTVPALLKPMLEHASTYNQSVERAPLRLIRSGGAPLSPALAEQVQRAFGVPVFQVYGLSEAPAIACHPLDSDVQKPGSVGRLMRNEVAILNEEDRPLPPGSSGEIAVRGPSVIPEYFRNEAATRRAIRNGWFHTGDIGHVDEDGYLFLTGRRSEFINRGGEKVAPMEVDEVLLSHPSVADALAFPIPDEELGEDIGAVIQLRPCSRTSAGDIQSFASTHLSFYKVPRRIFFVDAIPKGSTGKMARVKMFEQLRALNLDAGNPPIAPIVDPREEILSRLFAKTLGLPSVGRDDNFFDLGGGSLAATQCAAEIAHAFELKTFSPAAFLWAPTVAGMAKAVSEAGTGDEAAVFTIQAEGEGIPLFLVAPGTEVRILARNVGKRPVFGISLPNLERPAAPSTMKVIAEECVAALRRHRPHGPYALAGWCAAGILALEMAACLEQQGADVAFAALFDARDIYLPPMKRRRKALVTTVRQAQRVFFFFSRLRAGGLRVATGAIDRRVKGNAHTDAFNDALHRHRPAPWSGRVVHVWASQRPKGKFRDVEFAWAHISPGGFDYHEVSGDHLSMLFEPKLGEILAAKLDRAAQHFF